MTGVRVHSANIVLSIRDLVQDESDGVDYVDGEMAQAVWSVIRANACGPWQDAITDVTVNIDDAEDMTQVADVTLTATVKVTVEHDGHTDLEQWAEANSMALVTDNAWDDLSIYIGESSDESGDYDADDSVQNPLDAARAESRFQRDEVARLRKGLHQRNDLVDRIELWSRGAHGTDHTVLRGLIDPDYAYDYAVAEDTVRSMVTDRPQDQVEVVMDDGFVAAVNRDVAQEAEAIKREMAIDQDNGIA